MTVHQTSQTTGDLLQQIAEFELTHQSQGRLKQCLQLALARPTSSQLVAASANLPR
jgi:hypothetical protein